MIGFAAIAPHGEVEDTPELLEAMHELGRRHDGSTTIVVTPHNVHVEGHFAVSVAARVGEHEVDRGLALRLVRAIRDAGLPVVGASWGGNDATQAELPLDWGTEVPLRYLRAPKIVVVAPARDLSLADHIRLGEAINACGTSSQALIASADHGHAHDPSGPYGFDPAAVEYDARFRELVPTGDFRPLADLVEAAKADSLWQLLVLQGAVAGRGGQLLAYAAPSYYGMAVADFST